MTLSYLVHVTINFDLILIWNRICKYRVEICARANRCWLRAGSRHWAQWRERSAACWSFTVGDDYYENGLDPARELEQPGKMTTLGGLSERNTGVSCENTEVPVK